MPQPTIDFNQIADSVTAVLNQRASEAQTTQREAERLADEQTQRESEQATADARARIENEWTNIQARLSDLVERRAASLVSENLHRVQPEVWATLEQQFANVSLEKRQLQSRYPFLKG